MFCGNISLLSHTFNIFIFFFFFKSLNSTTSHCDKIISDGVVLFIYVFVRIHFHEFAIKNLVKALERKNKNAPSERILHHCAHASLHIK